MKLSVLVFVGNYLPGVRSGGPIRSIGNMVEALGDELDFGIVTSDRDAGDTTHYSGIQPDRWMQVGKARVLYLSEKGRGAVSLFRLLKCEKVEVLYLNSFFSRRFSILPLIARAAGARGQVQVILAPRGEFSPGALQIHRLRKLAYIGMAKRLTVYKDVIWHASSAYEEADIRRVLGAQVRVRVALPFSFEDPQAATGSQPVTGRPRKEPDALKVAFLSRIVPKKNLLGALRVLGGVSGRVDFNIYGPAEDGGYWRQCETEARKLPANVNVQFRSEIRHEDVQAILAGHHVLLFPTMGENYGHVIREALSAGCLPVISDRTPWRGLEKHGAGWDLPLEEPGLFTAALERCLAMNHEEFLQASQHAREFVRSFSVGEKVLADNRAVFELRIT